MRSPEMVSTFSCSVTSMSSLYTPASSSRITRSSPFANTSAFGTQALACVLGRSSYSGSPPVLPSSLLLFISLARSRNPRKGLVRLLRIFLLSSPPLSYALELWYRRVEFGGPGRAWGTCLPDSSRQVTRDAREEP